MAITSPRSDPRQACLQSARLISQLDTSCLTRPDRQTAPITYEIAVHTYDSALAAECQSANVASMMSRRAGLTGLVEDLVKPPMVHQNHPAAPIHWLLPLAV
jgi:hypothetical protein